MNPLCQVTIEFKTLADLKSLIDKCGAGTAIISERFTTDIWRITGNCENAVDRGSAWISRVSANPTQASIIDAIKGLNGADVSGIIAIGGGSSIDLAKTLSAFYYLFNKKAPTVDDINSAMVNKSYASSNMTVDITAVPSTSGTGSEVTKWATVWDIDKSQKYSIDDVSMYAKKALIIPELTVSLPAKLTLATALDALCHASEAFWAKATTPIVGDIACRAVDIIMENLKPCLNDLENLHYRERLASGSVLAGIAFSQTRTTACHSISYPITMRYGVMHGLACALTLDPVSKINRGAFANSSLLFDIYKRHGGLKSWLDDVCSGIADLSLRSFGVGEEEIMSIAEAAFTKGRMDNNPVDLTRDEVYDILRQVF